MLTADIIILQYVCPAFGMILANFMFAAPLKSVRAAISTGTLGPINPTPWAFMTGNCIGWVTYSFLINNLFVFFANAPGLILSVWLNMAAAKLQYCDRVSQSMRSSFVQLLDMNRKSFRIPKRSHVDYDDCDEGEDGENDKENGGEEGGAMASLRQHPPRQRPTLLDGNNDIHTFANIRKMAINITIQKASIPAPHEKVVVTIVSIWIATISILYFLHLTIEQWKLIIGFIVNINLLFFYGAPLSTIYTVLSLRNSNSIHRPTMLLNTANAVFWTAFGIGTLDWFIIVPNGLGAILGFVQMILRLIVPSRDCIDDHDQGGGGVLLTSSSSTSLSPSLGKAAASKANKRDLELGGDAAATTTVTTTATSPSNPPAVVEG